MTARRDQRDRPGVHQFVSGIFRRALLALAAVLGLAACGGLDSPDLATGTLRGRVANASTGAYVYPLARPDLKVTVGGDGSFVIEKVPAETAALVVVDGPALDGTRKAALVPVEVEGAEENQVVDVDAAAMPLAGGIAATVQLACGANVGSPRFTAVGSEHVGVAAVAGVAELDPLPAGTFDLVASMPGFRDGMASVAVTPGATTLYAVPLEVDLDDDEPGCVATDCRNKLVCYAGYCYECYRDDDCVAKHGAGSTCDQYACRMPPGTPGYVCDACTSDADCGSGLVCVPGAGYCTRTCGSSLDCGGLECQLDATRGVKVCVTTAGCSTYRAALGSACFENEDCARMLANGTCTGVNLAVYPPVPGYCTASCNATPDVCAAVQGFACIGSMGFAFCRPTP